MPGPPPEATQTLIEPAAQAQKSRGTPRRVTPTTETGKTATDFVPADVFYSFRGVVDSLTYWMPKGLNESVATARTFTRIVG